jgi:hypothetical protein
MTVTITIPDAQAHAFAQALKRAGFNDWRRLAVDDTEAYAALFAAEEIRRALADAGINPR